MCLPSSVLVGPVRRPLGVAPLLSSNYIDSSRTGSMLGGPARTPTASSPEDEERGCTRVNVGSVLSPSAPDVRTEIMEDFCRERFRAQVGDIPAGVDVDEHRKSLVYPFLEVGKADCDVTHPSGRVVAIT